MPTMEKDDVIYGTGEKIKPDAVDWTKIVNLTKPIPLSNLGDAKKACEAAAADPGLANAYVKVGLIGDDLYLRVKMKTGKFKKNIREDTLLAHGYRKLKVAMVEEKAGKEKAEKETGDKSQKILGQTEREAAAQGQLSERIKAEFELAVRTGIAGKHQDILTRIKACGDLLNKKPLTRADAVSAKGTHAAILPMINGLEKGLQVADALVAKNAFELKDEKGVLEKYRHVAVFRNQHQQFGVRIQAAVDAARAAAVVSDEYRVARDKVLADYRKVINDIKALQPGAAALAGPAAAANGIPAISQQFAAIEAYRLRAVAAFAPTREGGDVSENMRKVLAKEDIADYVFDLTTEAKAENLALNQGVKAAFAALEPKLTGNATPEGKQLLAKVQAGQRSMNN